MRLSEYIDHVPLCVLFAIFLRLSDKRCYPTNRRALFFEHGEVENFSVESLKWERKKVSLNKDIMLIFPDLCKQVPFKGKNFLFSKYGLNRLEMETSRK